MDTGIEKKLSRRIRELRKKKRLTQEKLAELAGIDYKHIQLLEGKNPSMPKLDTVEKIAEAFNISITKLLDFK